MIRHCEIHGDYEAVSINFGAVEMWSQCPKCEAEQIEAEQAELRQQEAQRIEKLLNLSGIPELFKRSTIDNYRVNSVDQERAVNLCRDYIAMFEKSICSDPLFLVGKYGTGKTHLAISIMKRLLSLNYIKTGYYVTTMKMIRDIRSSYHHSSEQTEQEIIDKYIGKDLLILDEVGVQAGTDNEKLLIYEVLNGRYENLRPTILISNYTLLEIKDYLSARVFDRLQGKNKLLIVFDWKSERGK